MAILIGIDEAGYGPLLGPLVISKAAVCIPDELLKEDMWLLLKNAVSKEKKKLAGRLLVTDSKKAYNRKTGLGHVEKTVHSFLSVLGHKPRDLYELIKVLCPNCIDRVSKYGWYNRLPESKIDLQEDVISLSSKVLSKSLSDIDAQMLELNSICLDVGYYNQMLDAVKNKSTVAFTQVCKLIMDSLKKYNGKDFQVIVDRQGGRTNYTQPLMSMFEGFELTVIRQDEKISSYEMKKNGLNVKIHFAVKADDKSLAVSLASIVSKYLRELLMEQINSYFMTHSDELKPTAGYWTDGQRFLADVERLCPSAKFDKKMLVRTK